MKEKGKGSLGFGKKNSIVLGISGEGDQETLNCWDK